ncbi:RDD family protein [Streptomyces buecherae]|uniref:RDD family protein n=1 Tax=Streptomyces buecherae TaxID=2763006 RepID=UPI003655F361
MSVPGDSGPTQGYYPDPSIPGYIRYWNGAAWVPGTSRPAPSEGEAVPAPPPDADGQGPQLAPTEQPPIDTTQQAGAVPDQTGPVFFDEQPDAGGPGGALPELRPRGEVGVRTQGATRPGDAVPWHDPQQPPDSGPAPGGGWYADTSRQVGFGGDADQRVSWGADDAPAGRPGSVPAWGDGPGDPRVVPPTGIAPAPAPGPAAPGLTVPDPTAAVEPPQARGRELDAGAAPRAALPAGGTPVVPRQGAAAPTEPAPADAVPGHGTGQPGVAGQPGATGAEGAAPRASGDGTLTIRALRRERQGAEPGGGQGQSEGAPPAGPATPGGRDGTLTIRAQGRGGDARGRDVQARAGQVQAGPAAPTPPAQPATTPAPATTPPPAPAVPHQGAHPQPVPGTQIPPQGAPLHAPAPGPAQPAPASALAAPGPGAGQADWAQRVHDLAQPAGPDGARAGSIDDVIPWKPPVDNPFLSAAQAQGRPAGLGRRLTARLVDTLVLGGLVGAVVLPLWTRAKDHIDEKVEEAKQTGETVTVYLLDGTTGGYLALALAALLLLGVVYEALPTARWGRTLGKKLCGVRVLDIEDHDTPTFGAALRRWLVYGVLGLLVIGLVNVVWCLFDRPWRQCWHDKAARTFVASGRE